MAHDEDVSPNVQIAVYTTVGIISLLSNSMIFLVVGCTQKLRTATYLFLLNLALTDCLIIIIGIPVQIANLAMHGGPVTHGICCDIHGWLILMTFISSNFNLVLISVHRYTLVVKSHLYKQVFSKYHIIIAIILVWFLSLAVGFPPLFGWGRYSYDFNRAHCMVDWEYSESYVIFLQIVAFPVPLGVMCFCYYKVFKESSTSRKRLQQSSQDISKAYKKKTKEYKLTKMLLLVLICFFMLFLPYAILIFMEGYFHHPPPHAYSFFAMVMAYSNSICNFWIYAVMSIRFRKALKKVLKEIFQKLNCVTIATLETSNSTAPDEKSCDQMMNPGVYAKKINIDVNSMSICNVPYVIRHHEKTMIGKTNQSFIT